MQTRYLNDRRCPGEPSRATRTGETWRATTTGTASPCPYAAALILLLALLAACQPRAAAPAATPAPDVAAITRAWQAGPHAETYALDKGPNTYCARCHSPHNWDPGARVDPPPNCVSCKFPSDPAPRQAPHNPLVEPAAWRSIGCDVCHPANEDGSVSAAIAWLNAPTGRYETVATSTALCERCHADTATLRHRRDLGTAAHAGFSCTRCHDPHTAAASCTAAGCHAPGAQPATPVPGHDPAHQAVTCGACHDAAGLAAGPGESGSAWITYRTTELLGRASTAPYRSHALQRAVDCARCHYPDNPWGLKVPANGAAP